MANKKLILQLAEDSSEKTPTLIALYNVLTAPNTQDQTFLTPFSKALLIYRLQRTMPIVTVHLLRSKIVTKPNEKLTIFLFLSTYLTT